MKILYLAAIRLPTEEAQSIQIMKTCEAFAMQGAKVELMVPARHNTVTDDPFSYYGIQSRFTLTYLTAKDAGTLGTIGFIAALLSFAEAVHFTASYWTADIIYSRDALILAQYVLQGRRLVYEAHKKPTLISGFLAKRAYRVVVVSESMRKAYEKIGVRKDRIIVAPGAIDPVAFGENRQGQESMLGARARLDLPTNKKIALYVGSLTNWKGVATLFEASKLLPSDVLMVVIGGESSQVAGFKKQYPNVYFLGSRLYQQLPNNQALADVLVLPYTAKDKNSRLYASPLKLFTYMASKRPIVAADLPSIREVLTEESAYFFVPDDANSLAQKIVSVLSEMDVAEAKALKAYELTEKYTWTARATCILSHIPIT